MNNLPLESAWLKTFYKEITVPSLNNQESHFFALVALICLLFFSSFFSRPSGLPEHHMLNGSFKSYFSIYAIFINSAIYKCHMALKWIFLYRFLRGGTSRLPENRRQIFYSSYKRYCSYLRPSDKFHHEQVPNGSKNRTFGAMSQMEKLELVGYQNFYELF